MGNPAKDSYADLLKVLDQRRKDYLFRLTTDEATFAADPETFGVAMRRGFLKGHGPRPQCSLLAQDEAAVAADDKHHLTVWTDNECLRAGIPEPWDSEDTQAVIARLFTIADKDEFKKSIPIPEEPPDESKTSLGFRPLLRLLRQLTVCGRGEFRGRIRALLAGAKDGQILDPDYNPFGPFDSAVIEKVVESLDGPQEPDPGDIAKREDLVRELTGLTLEGEKDPIDAGLAQMLLKGIYALLPSSVSVPLLRAAIDKGRPGPYLPRTALGTRESPGSFGARESPGSFGARESPGSFGARETPPST